jgi:hypothetical protein
MRRTLIVRAFRVGGLDRRAVRRRIVKKVTKYRDIA